MPVLLQPMKEEPSLQTKCRDKFLVQSAYITPDREHTPVAELVSLCLPSQLSTSRLTQPCPDARQWSVVEAEHKAGAPDAIFEQKIRCAFLPPLSEDGLGSVQETAEDGSPNLSRNGGSSFLAAESTPSKFANGDGLQTAPSSAFAERSAPGIDAKGQTNAQQEGSVAAGAAEKLQAAGLPSNTSELKTAASNAASTVSNAASNAAASVGLNSQSREPSSTGVKAGSSSSANLQSELATARAEIEKLKASLREKESEGLRQRNVGSSGESRSSAVGSQVATVKQEGIPAQMVAALCFGVFLFTWCVLPFSSKRASRS